MSLLGKILAFLNVLGVVGVLALGAMTYSKKQAWANAVALQELRLRGLPLDEKELDNQGVPLVENLNDDNVKALLGGRFVRTQADEVEYAHAQLKNLETAGTQQDQIKALAAALVPFTTEFSRYTELVLLQ